MEAFQWAKEAAAVDGLHYGALIDACAKCGALDKAFECALKTLRQRPAC